MINNKKNKVLVCMSGGVDSSVAAALLLKKGYDVTGAFMVNYDDNLAKTCWAPDYRDAVRVAAKLGIPLMRLNFTKEYKEKVLDYMYKEYEVGRTPNPDVLCNLYIKFGVWMEKAKELGFDYLATGHYARLRREIPNTKIQIPKIMLLEAKDKNKDQTYFLHQLNQKQLTNTLFPIGGYTKDEVRKIAKKFGLPTAEKEESMGICFVGEVPMKEFLQKKIKIKKGKMIFSPTGEVIGEHDGFAFYTIGQRHLGVESEKLKVKSIERKPLYVVDKRLKNNELVLGYEDDPLLFKKEIEVQNVNWINGQEQNFPIKCLVRLRHRQELQKAKIKNIKSKIFIEFDQPQRAVTPGQFAVFYKNGKCLGGGVIL